MTGTHSLLILFEWVVKNVVYPPEFSKDGTKYQSISNTVCVHSNLHNARQTIYKLVDGLRQLTEAICTVQVMVHMQRSFE